MAAAVVVVCPLCHSALCVCAFRSRVHDVIIVNVAMLVIYFVGLRVLYNFRENYIVCVNVTGCHLQLVCNCVMNDFQIELQK